MRTIIVILSFALCGLAFGQSLYQPCKKSGDNYYEENFIVKVNQTSYGPYFDSFDRCLTDDLKKGIERFIKETQFKEYRKNGEHSIHIIKDRGKYYVIEKESPKSLFELK